MVQFYSKKYTKNMIFLKKDKIYILLIFITVFASNISKAQYHEAGIALGASTYKGEMTNNNLMNVTSPSYNVGAFYRLNINRVWALRASASYSLINQDDADAKNDFALLRGHKFEAQIIDVSAIIEYNFMNFRQDTKGKKRTRIVHYFSPYAFTGIGLLGLNQRYNLQPTYGSNHIFIPLGVGIKSVITQNLNLGVEFQAKFAFTDYLDDVGVDVDRTQVEGARDPFYYTGNPNDNDMYFFTGITLSYIFPNIGKDCPGANPKNKNYDLLRR